MDSPAKELAVSRLIAGCLRCRLTDISGRERLFLLKTPDRYQRYIAQEVYDEVSKEADLLNRHEMLLHMVDEELWSEEEEQKIVDLEKNLDELKVGLFHLQFKSSEARQTKQMITTTIKELESLHEKKHRFDADTCEGVASMARLRYLVGASLSYPNGQSVFEGEDAFWRGTSLFLDQALEVYAQNRISEVQVRELARTEPWRSLWSARKAEGSVFGLPAADLSEDQKILLTWSTVYDSIFEHPECPHSSVIEDDDMLDGWMIIQRRKRESDADRNRADSLITNEKIKNSEEIFVVVNNAEDAKKVEALNDTGARITKRKRMNLVKNRGGNVNEAEMPDSKLKIQQQVNQQFAQHVRGK